MAKTDYQSVDEYLAAQPQETRAALEVVRRAIRKALPKAEERISYQIAAFRTDAGNVIYFAGWKKHVSVYPVGADLAARFDGELDPYMAQKDTLRFPLAEAVPAKLIERVARARAAQAEEYVAAKRAAKKRSAKKRSAKKRPAKKGPAKKGSTTKSAAKPSAKKKAANGKASKKKRSAKKRSTAKRA